MIRKPVVAGQFYPDDFTGFSSQIEESFRKGPDILPSNKRRRIMFGAIIPHAGYSFSGRCAAWAYN